MLDRAFFRIVLAAGQGPRAGGRADDLERRLQGYAGVVAGGLGTKHRHPVRQQRQDDDGNG